MTDEVKAPQTESPAAPEGTPPDTTNRPTYVEPDKAETPKPEPEPLKEIITPSNKEVIIIAEQSDGVVQPVTYELLGAGRDLANKLEGRLTCIVLGYELGDEVNKLIEYG